MKGGRLAQFFTAGVLPDPGGWIAGAESAVPNGLKHLAPGDIVKVMVDEAGEYDLWGQVV